MQHFKMRMTKLRHLIERLPDDRDIFNYPGISKEMLLKAFETANNLAQGIPDDDPDNQLIIISLKRLSSNFYNKYKKFLDSDSELPSQDEFDGFIDDVSALIEKTKSVYFICDSGRDHSASELQGLKTEVEEFKRFKASYSQEYEEAKKEVEELHDIKTNLEALSKETKLFHDSAKDNSDAVDALKTNVSNHADQVEKWGKSIDECQKTIDSARTDITELKTNYEELSQSINDIHDRSGKALSEIDGGFEKSKKLLDEAESTLSDSNRHSMAASFKSRKDELLAPMWLWGLALVGAIVGIILIVALGPRVDFSDGFKMAAIGPLLFRMALIAPCVWLGWYAGKQYGFTVRVREDYSFKYACSVAYEGFKKAAGGSDTQLGQILLELCMLNMAQQPLRVYADSKFGVKGLPIEEFIDTVGKKLPHPESLELECGRTKLKTQFSQDNEDWKNTNP